MGKGSGWRQAAAGKGSRWRQAAAGRWARCGRRLTGEACGGSRRAWRVETRRGGGSRHGRCRARNDRRRAARYSEPPPPDPVGLSSLPPCLHLYPCTAPMERRDPDGGVSLSRDGQLLDGMRREKRQIWSPLWRICWSPLFSPHALFSGWSM